MTTMLIGRTTAMAAPSAAPDAVPSTYGIGQRVADQALERGTRDGQGGTDEHRREHPRHPQVPDDRLGRGRPGPPEVEPEGPPQDHPDAVGRTDPDRPQPDPDDERECEGHEHDARDDARAAPKTAGETDRSDLPGHRANGHRPPYGAGGIWMSGQIAMVSARSPAASRGPGRVISMSLTARIMSSLTAVITFQPGRAATAVGVGE